MPQNNNNQKVAPNAVYRVAKLPVVRSACSTLSVLYKETKCSSSSLRSLCEALEDRVTALSSAAYTKVSPVIVKLEPQISIANNFACKGLDWLETSFPVLLSPTKEVVTTAKNKINDIQDVVSTAASGTIDCVQHTVTWVRNRMPQADGVNQSLVDRAISVATVVLDSALTRSEALIDHVLPPTDEDSEKQAHLEGFEAASHGKGYPVRMINLTTKLCQRTYHTVGSKIPSFQVRKSLTRSTVLVQDLQTSYWTLWSLQGLPQYLQHQAVSVFFFFTQMYNLSCQSQREQLQGRRLGAAEASVTNGEQVHLQDKPAFRMRPTRTAVLENGCNIKGCVEVNGH